MESFVQAEIFFFISSVATIVFVLLVSVLLIYLIMAGRNLHTLSVRLKNDYRESEKFVAELKERLNGNFIFNLLFPPRRGGETTTESKTKKRARK